MSNWKTEPLKEVLSTLESGGRPAGGAKHIREGVPSIGGEHLNSQGKFNFNKLKYVPETYFKSMNRGIVRKGDILIVKDGATTGKTSFVSNEFPYEKATVNEHVFIARSNNKVFEKFLFYYLFSLEGQIQLKKSISGSAQGGINLSVLDKISVRYPESLQEQQLIVQEIEKHLTRLDEAVKALKNVEEKLKVYRKAVLNKSFYGEGKTLPQIVSSDKHSIKRGPFGGSLKKEIFVPSGYKIYEQKHAIQNNFTIGKYYITKEKFEEMIAFSVKSGDFIISCSGTIGKIAEVPKDAKEGIINQALLKLSLDNSKILNKYFQYIFQSEYIQRHLTKISRGVAIKNVPSVKELKTIKFPVPSHQEQQTIVQSIESKFSVIDKVEEIVDNALEKSELMRKSILKSAFEGNLVKVNA